MPLASFSNFVGPDLIVLALLIFIIGVPIAIAMVLNRRFQRRNPGKRPYRWGYYFSVSCVMGWLMYGLSVAMDHADITIPIICGAIYAVLAWFFALRHHWAWITLTILSCNPIAWIINFIYLRKRWSEDSVAAQTI